MKVYKACQGECDAQIGSDELGVVIPDESP